MNRFPAFGLSTLVLLALTNANPARSEIAPAKSSEEKTAHSTVAPMVKLQASDLPFRDVVKMIAAQANANILLEPGVDLKISERFAPIALDDALNRIVGEGGMTWAKLSYVKKANASPPQSSLFDLVRAMNALSAEKMSVSLSGSGKALMSTQGATAPPLKTANGETLTTLYVIALKEKPNPADASKEKSAVADNAGSAESSPSIDRFGQLSQQRLDLMQNMSQGERRQAIQQELQTMMQLSPAARLQLFMDRRDAFQSLPQDLKDQMRQAWRDIRQQMGWGPRGGGNQPTQSAPPAPATPKS